MDLEEVVERAIEFLERKAGYQFHKLLRADYRVDEDKWYLEFDVGILSERIVKIVISGRDGRVVFYEVVSKGS